MKKPYQGGSRKVFQPTSKVGHAQHRRPGAVQDITAFRLLIEYDGGRFAGWQKQGPKQTAAGVRTVAGIIEKILYDAGCEALVLMGSGRTDAGVHALGQVAHLHLASKGAPKAHELQRLFNDALPHDLAVREVRPCSGSFHARHDAMERSYLYQLSSRRSAFAKPYVWWVKRPLNLQKLKSAWGAYQGSHDFSAFADLELGEDARVQVRACEAAEPGSLVLLRITATHFLRSQVRRMVGAAVSCALGDDDPARILADLKAPTKEANLHWGKLAAPAAGLFLERVRYSGDPETGALNPVVSVY
ncbi:MAG: tRNA pseudouridine synthase A [Holophagaceae bacterium]|nr:tRNA pseudouridine synthase A [Holophagaceae bacterium]